MSPKNRAGREAFAGELTEALGGRPSDDLVAQLEGSIERFKSDTALKDTMPANVRWLELVGKLAGELRSTLVQGPDIFRLPFLARASEAELAAQDVLHALEREALRAARLYKAKRGHPSEHARELLAVAVASALSDAGVRLTKTDTGRLANTLRVVLQAAGATIPLEVRPLVRRVVDRGR